MNRRNAMKALIALGLAPSVALSDYRIKVPAPGVKPETKEPRHAVFGSLPEENIESLDGGRFRFLSFEGAGSTAASPAGILFTDRQDGDFTFTIEIEAWLDAASGFLGIVLLDEQRQPLLNPIEIASYTGWTGGKPFPRQRSPYNYTTASPSLSETVTLTVSRSGETINAEAKWGGYVRHNHAITHASPVHLGVYHNTGHSGVSHRPHEKIIRVETSW